MILRDVLPHPALREYIQCFRICHFEFGDSDVPVKAWAPKPENILHFILRGSLTVQHQQKNKYVLPPVALLGQRTSLVRQFTESTFLNVHMVFQPTAVYRLTGIPAFELTDQHFDASLIFDRSITSTHDRLQHAKTYAEALNIIEDFAFQLVKYAHPKAPGVDTVSRTMITKGVSAPVDVLAGEACLCTKQFKRKFFERVGVNPKTYSKIIRLNKAYNLKNAFPEKDWLDIAVQCGYYDYQHLMKDYKAFTGSTPNEFHRIERLTPEFILGLTEHLYQERVANYNCPG